MEGIRLTSEALAGSLDSREIDPDVDTGTGSHGQAMTIRIDPFGYWPGFASSIQGLGGNDPSSFPDYAFHSPYVFTEGNTLIARLRFEGLEPGSARVSIRVYRMSDHLDGMTVVFHRDLSADEIIAQGGELTIEVDTPKPGNYAVAGQSNGSDRLSASGLTVDIERSLGSFHERQVERSRERLFGERALRSARSYISAEPALLADPASQMCTSAQFEEPVYRQWTDRLGLHGVHMHRKQWEFVYVLQALERSGVLCPGRSGIGFGIGRERLPALMAARGCRIIATDLDVDDARSSGWSSGNQHSAALEDLRFPEICPDDAFDRNVSFRPVDMTQIPDDLVDFDFAWSSCAFEHLGSISAGLRFVERSLDCVKPGGIVVHTTELNLTSNGKTADRGGTVLFRRRDIERLAARLTRLGHAVAPIKYDAGIGHADGFIDVPPYGGDFHLKVALGKYVTTSFGIIVRKTAAERPRRSWLGRRPARI